MASSQSGSNNMTPSYEFGSFFFATARVFWHSPRRVVDVTRVGARTPEVTVHSQTRIFRQSSFASSRSSVSPRRAAAIGSRAASRVSPHSTRRPSHATPSRARERARTIARNPSHRFRRSERPRDAFRPHARGKSRRRRDVTASVGVAYPSSPPRARAPPSRARTRYSAPTARSIVPAAVRKMATPVARTPRACD